MRLLAFQGSAQEDISLHFSNTVVDEKTWYTLSVFRKEMFSQSCRQRRREGSNIHVKKQSPQGACAMLSKMNQINIFSFSSLPVMSSPLYFLRPCCIAKICTIRTKMLIKSSSSEIDSFTASLGISPRSASRA